MNLLKRYQRLSLWNKIAFWGSVASVVGLALYFFGAPSLNQTVVSPQGSTIIQSGRDTVLIQMPSAASQIRSLVLEGRLTCSLKPGAELPPPDVEFVMVGDGHAYLEGTLGRFRVEFLSPVRFYRQEDGNVVVINRFALSAGSDLSQRPLTALRNLEELKIPVVTVVYGNAIDKMKLYTVNVSVNSSDLWSYSYKLDDAAFQAGRAPVFTIPLGGLKTRINSLQ